MPFRSFAEYFERFLADDLARKSENYHYGGEFSRRQQKESGTVLAGRNQSQTNFWCVNLFLSSNIFFNKGLAEPIGTHSYICKEVSWASCPISPRKSSHFRFEMMSNIHFNI